MLDMDTTYGLHGKTKVVMQLLAEQHILRTNHEPQIASLLEDIADNAFSKLDFNFYNGVTGIGWCVELISQFRLLDIDTNEVFEDLDDMVYKYYFSNETYDLSLEKGLLGLFLYYAFRQKAVTRLHHYKAILNEECLILIIDKILELLTKDESGIFAKSKLSEADYYHLWLVMYFFSDFFEDRVNQKATEQILYAVISFVDKHLDQKLKDGERSLVLLLTAQFYFIAGQKHAHEYWSTRALDFIKNMNGYGSSNDNNLNKLSAIINENYIKPEGEYSESRASSLIKQGLDPLYEAASKAGPYQKAFEIFYLLAFAV